MIARPTVASDAVFRLPGGTEDNDLYVTTYGPDDGGPALGSTWVPTDEERAAIAAGANIELVVWGAEHPPVAMRLSDYELAQHPGPNGRSHGDDKAARRRANAPGPAQEAKAPMHHEPTQAPRPETDERPCWNCGATPNIRCCEFGREPRPDEKEGNDA